VIGQPNPARRSTALAAIALAVLAVVGCGSAAQSSGASSPPESIATADPGLLDARLNAIDGAVGRWRSATDLATAQRAAEEARNLVVGPHGPTYGDASAIGLLPGLGGEPGLATAATGPCVERDVLGGSWADPAARWSILEAAISAWTPSNNTFPGLPSHPQRIVGWATLSLATAELPTALEYGGHAQLHVDAALRAVSDCAG
jgi:hypothetical protein